MKIKFYYNPTNANEINRPWDIVTPDKSYNLEKVIFKNVSGITACEYINPDSDKRKRGWLELEGEITVDGMTAIIEKEGITDEKLDVLLNNIEPDNDVKILLSNGSTLNIKKPKYLRE